MINLGIAFASLVLCVGEIDYGRFVTIAEEGELSLEVQPYESTIAERAPLAMRIRLRNVSKRTVHTFYKEGHNIKNIDRFSLHAVSEAGQEIELKRLELLHANTSGAPGAPFEPDAVLQTDEAMCLRIARTSGEFLGPGRYKVYATLRCPPEIRSNEFSLTVLPATGSNGRASALLETLPYYVQGELQRPKIGDTWALGGKPDEIRSTLDRISKECPDSVFVLWLEYWEAMHGMKAKEPDERKKAVDRAISFVQENETFPLADNLLARAASSLLWINDVPRARELVEKIQKSYADGDAIVNEIPGLLRKLSDIPVTKKPD